MTTDLASPFLKKICQLKMHGKSVRAFAWAPNGRWLGSCSAEGISIWGAANIANDSRPRFLRRPSSAPTTLSWNADGTSIASGCENGEYAVWDTQQFELIPDTGAPVRGPIRCLAWSPTSPTRLAFGGSDRLVHFERFQSGKPSWREQGFGHTSPIVSVAWSPDGGSVVTGTEKGTIGLWQPFSVPVDGLLKGSPSPLRADGSDQDWSEHYGLRINGPQRFDVQYPLTSIFSQYGIFAHDQAVTSLAWAGSSGNLASGSLDGTVRLWSVDGSPRDEVLQLDHPILHLEFSYSDKFLIIQTSESIIFSLADKLSVVLEVKHRSHHDTEEPTRNCGLAVNRDARMVTIDPDDPTSAQIWKVNFAALIARAHQKHRPYHAIGVSLFGEPCSGKSSLARAIAGLPYSNEREISESLVYNVSMATLSNDVDVDGDDTSEVREIVLWDTAGETEHPIIQRIQVGDCSVALIVLQPVHGAALCDSVNLVRWQETIRSCRSILPREIAHCFVVITCCDQAVPMPVARDAEKLVSLLRAERVFLTSAESGAGIDLLKKVLLGEISWEHAISFWSSEALSQLDDFACQAKSGSNLLCSVQQFHADFFRINPLAGELFKGGGQFRQALRILELKGRIRFFETGDHIVFDPVYYRNYASTMVIAAQKDQAGMGRLPLESARLGAGPQISLDPTHRLPDMREHSKLLALSIDEMLEAKVAQTVSTDGVSYLVFPRTLARMRDGAEPRPPVAARCKIAGAVDDIFSALIVRLLGQRVHYPKESLWRNEASFEPAAGGKCNIALTPTEDNLEATVALSFDAATSETEKAKFIELVKDHFTTSPNTVFDGLEILVAEQVKGNASTVYGAGERVEVFFSWRPDADVRVEKNVNALAAHLRDGIEVIGDTAIRLGTTDAEYIDRVKNVKVALFLFAKRPTVEHLKEYRMLESSGARIIPVILPSAPKTLEIPGELKKWTILDLRGQFLEVSALRSGIMHAWQAGPIQRTKETGHVFLSYFREDLDQVSELVGELNGAGHKVWWDQDSTLLAPGSRWDHEFRAAIKQSYAHIVCLSPNLRSKSWVYEEIDLAIELQRRMARDRIFIIPVRLAECDVQDFFDRTAGNDMHLQHVDYFGPRRGIAKLDAVLIRAKAER